MELSFIKITVVKIYLYELSYPETRSRHGTPADESFGSLVTSDLFDLGGSALINTGVHKEKINMAIFILMWLYTN